MSEINKVNFDKPANNPMETYCPNCNQLNLSRVEKIEEIYPVRGEKIKINALVRFCNKCGEQIFDEELDSQNLNQAYNVFRNKNNYLSSKEIELIRKEYGLSQRGLAILLDWSPSTVTRYETGAVPSPSQHNILLSLKNNKKFAKELFERKSNQLGNLDRKRMKSKLDDIQEELAESDTIQLITEIYNKYSDNIYSGFNDFNFDKLSNLILYISAKMPKVSKTKVMTLLFYSDFKNYKEFGLSITGMTYQHLSFGPVPYHYWLMLDSLTFNKIIELKPFENFEGEYLEPLNDYDLSLFSADEIETLQKVISYFKNFDTAEISNYSHEEKAYLKTRNRDLISYDYADELKEFYFN
ncbi:type II TA system antitoxin MqsA family protein [Peribacillus simplex]|uniref:type II TA system antitoxin MqsA family protein n=1 Tax=Peribacillus simplex TaxID=1478 RepID=UPI0011DC8C57|nr:type II TA system antitoxin MqsA family protein [Peribacillus simplex]